MSLTPRQILILLVLIAGFGIAAFVVSRGENGAAVVVSRGASGAPAADQARWCSEAPRLEGVGPFFRGEVADATVEEIDDVTQAIFAVETLAPGDLWSSLARLADFTLIAGQQRAELDWPAAYEAARENKEAVLDEALASLEVELGACGVPLG